MHLKNSNQLTVSLLELVDVNFDLGSKLSPHPQFISKGHNEFNNKKLINAIYTLLILILLLSILN
jgi:hypothetical protein